MTLFRPAGLSADAKGIRLTPAALAFGQRERRNHPLPNPSPVKGEGL